ncbi:MAG: peptidoglycan-binding protein [Acidobacteria bacterium]|nr:peptidoglycan-binding protein [Acidobacteriota bacterium]MBV9625941.1 peptidoglycan-binding protein [Acidobacteriota bacterium]
MLAVTVLLTASLAIAGTEAKERPPAPQRKAHKSAHNSRKAKPRPHGQQAIDGDRARQIQDALAREHYLSGTPSGVWDSSTEEALRRYQSDHGWQTRTVPDSRALIRLGLGPGREHLLNPESAMTSGPQIAREDAVAVSTASAGPTAPSAVPDHLSPSAPDASPAGAPTR